MSDIMPKGYECTKCKRKHQYPAYIYAHWRELIDHTCECGVTHTIVCGVACLKKRGKQIYATLLYKNEDFNATTIT